MFFKNCDKICDKNCDKNCDNIKIKNQYIHNLKLIQQSISLNNLYILLYGQSNSININLYNELILNFNEYNLYIHTYVNNRLLINDTQKLLEKHFNNKNIIIDIEDDIKNYLMNDPLLDCFKNSSYNTNLMSNDINSNPLSLSNLFKMGIDFENKIINTLHQNYEIKT